MGGRRGFGMSSYAMTMNKTTIYPDFEDLDQTLNHLNAKLREKPVPGEVHFLLTFTYINIENYKKQQ